MLTELNLDFQVRFLIRNSDVFQMRFSHTSASGFIFSVYFNNNSPEENLTVSLRRQLIPSHLDTGALIVERGQEFETLGRVLQHQPAKQISQVQYQNNGQNEGAIDMGGPLRECFTEAYAQALNVLMKDTSLQGARKDIDHNIDILTVKVRAKQLDAFGRLLAYVADQPNINLPPDLFEQSFEAILTLAKRGDALGILGINEDAISVSELLQSVTQALSDDKTIFVDIVSTFLPEIKTALETHFNDPLAKYADLSQPTPEDAKNSLSEHLSDHLEQVLGFCYSPESDAIMIPEGNTRFIQLALIARGFNAVENARTNVLNATYPTDIKALAASIHGTGDIRRALSDPTYEKAFQLIDETQTLSRANIRTLKRLIHQWAAKASDQQLAAVCKAMTSSDVLPDRISNGTNRLMIQIRNIPVIQPNSDRVMGYAEFSPHTCFGTLEIAPSVVQEILAEHRQRPSQIPARLERLFGEELPSENQAFNAP